MVVNDLILHSTEYQNTSRIAKERVRNRTHTGAVAQATGSLWDPAVHSTGFNLEILAHSYSA